MYGSKPKKRGLFCGEAPVFLGQHRRKEMLLTLEHRFARNPGDMKGYIVFVGENYSQVTCYSLILSLPVNFVRMDGLS